jgi:hypothetical protein
VTGHIISDEQMSGIKMALEVLKERWRYLDGAVVAGMGERAEMARHEVYRWHEALIGRFGLPHWNPIPGTSKRG